MTDDLTLQRVAWSEAALAAYVEAERRLCHCEAVCTCGWDDPSSLVMQGIEREERKR